MEIRKVLSLLPVAVLTALIGAPSYALDTDVYLKVQGVSRNDAPRVLFIFDNSGSMSTTITTRPPYDPSVNYCTDDLDTVLGISGANGGKPGNCATIAGRIYVSFSNPRQPPNTSSNRWFDTGKNNCIDSQSSFASAGFYGGTKIARWRSGSGWGSLSGERNSDITYVDCMRDNSAGANSDNPTNTVADGMGADDGLRPRSSGASGQAYSPPGSEFNWAAFSSNTAPTLYNSNYMSYWHNSTLVVTRTRLEIAQDAVNGIVDANKSFWLGLEAFNENGDSDGNNSGRHGGRIVHKILDLNTPGLRTQYQSHVNNLGADTWTPLAESMWEAYLYWAGLPVDYGDNDGSTSPPRDNNATNPPGSGPYISPFDYRCQTGYIILITDGDPTIDTNANSKIQSRIGGNCDGSSCLDDLVGWMQNNDVYGGLPDTQAVTTYTIGFGSGISADGQALLQETASQGGGLYYTADDADQLTMALQGALNQILEKNTSFTAPSLSVNAFNRLFNREEIYLALFKPSNTCTWDGNIKKYKLCNKSDIDANRCDALSDMLDANNVEATDSITHMILDSARSYWSSAADGSEVTRGGAGAQVPDPDSRTVLTYNGSYAGLSASAPATPIPLVATVGNTFFDATVADPTILGLPATATQTEVAALVEWMRGKDSYDQLRDGPDDPAGTHTGVTTERRSWIFGDVLHSRPVAITYGGTSASPIMKLFVGTNDGYVRMLRADTGQEQWAFMPKEMYGMQYKLSQDANGDHSFGMDNTPTFWMRDVNKNGVIEPSDGDRVYMYFTMRRGGRNVYAFDVTPTGTLASNSATFTPRLMWAIEGGAGDFAKLGETWSRPMVVRVRGPYSVTSGTPRIVLMFGGGYDTNQDNGVPPPGLDTMGNAIYMVDPFTGRRLWWASSDNTANLVVPRMKHSIPSDLAIVDSDGDGSIDRLYVPDVNGQLFRVDFGETSGVNTSAHVFADFGCTGGTRADDCAATTAQNRRKFFYPPDIAPVRDTIYSTNPFYDAVTIGVGDREDPIDLLTSNLASPASKEAVHNRVYMLRDYNYDKGAPAVAPTVITEATTSLYNATSNLLGTATGAALVNEINNLKALNGWFVDLRSPTAITVPNGLSTQWVGEKILARTTILDGVLFATSYTPANDANASISCKAQEGVATQYTFDLLTATAGLDVDGDGVKDRFVVIGGGIPSEVVPVYLPDGGTTVVQAGGGLFGSDPKNRNTAKRHAWQGCPRAPGAADLLCGE